VIKRADNKKGQYMNHISVFSTGKLWEIDMARDALKQAGIPHFVREENLSGLRTAFPAAPAPGVGVTWCLMVPESIVEDAMQILNELSIDINKQPGFWDFTSDPRSIKGFKIFIWISLLIIVFFIIIEILYIFL